MQPPAQDTRIVDVQERLATLEASAAPSPH